jgi:succinyl-diaminopimelate desuccinylase
MHDILSLAEQLMRVRSTADRPEELERVVAAAELALSDAPGLCLRRYAFGGKPSLVASTRDTLAPDVMMVGHLDVVPGADDLFEPRYEGTVLRGRGACDMKVECAAMIGLMRGYAAEESPPNVALMLTTDEEIGGRNGVGRLVGEFGYRAKAALVPDGGSAPGDLIVRNKGVLHVRLTAHGRAAHGSRPWLGENAIERLTDAAARVTRAFPASDDAEHWHVTCSIGTIRGGTAVNQVPDVAECGIDIRFPETETLGGMLARVRGLAGACEVEALAGDAPVGIAADDPFVRRYAAIVREETGGSVTFGCSHGSNDGRYFAALGIPVIVSRPRSGGQHGPDEWLDTADLVPFQSTYRRFIESCRGG